MKQHGIKVFIFLALSSTLTLFLAPPSPAADFTEEELVAFRREAQEVHRVERDQDRIRFFEDAIARHEGHPLNIIFEYSLAQSVSRYPFHEDREAAERRKLGYLEAIISRYGDVDYFILYGHMGGWSRDPESIIPHAAADAARIEARYGKDMDKVRKYLETAFDYFVAIDERRRSRWPSAPPPDEPPAVASDDERSLFSSHRQNYEYQRFMIARGEFLSHTDTRAIRDLLRSYGYWSPEYRNPGVAEFRIREITTKYAGTIIETIAEKLIANLSQQTLRSISESMRTTDALDELFSTAPLDSAPDAPVPPSDGSGGFVFPADSAPSAPDSVPESATTVESPSVPADTETVPATPSAPDSRPLNAPAPRPSRTLPAALLALAALLLAASLYAFRRKRPSPENASPDKGHT